MVAVSVSHVVVTVIPVGGATVAVATLPVCAAVLSNTAWAVPTAAAASDAAGRGHDESPADPGHRLSSVTYSPPTSLTGGRRWPAGR